MIEEILSWPLAALIPVLWAIALVRGVATYWVARGGHVGYRKVRTDRPESATYRRAAAFLERFGPYAVLLCYVTIGLQTAVLALAGITRMTMGRFLPAVAAGALLWAIAYGTIGLAVVQAWVLTAAGSWWGIALIGALAALAALAWWRSRRTRLAA